MLWEWLETCPAWHEENRFKIGLKCLLAQVIMALGLNLRYSKLLNKRSNGHDILSLTCTNKAMKKSPCREGHQK